MRTGKTRILENCQWIEVFPQTAHDITVTLPVLNRICATRPEPTIYNNARDLRKYARTDQSPLLVKAHAWEAMLAHIARKTEREACKIELQKKVLMRERIKQLYFRAVATGEAPPPPSQPPVADKATRTQVLALPRTAQRHNPNIGKRGGSSAGSTDPSGSVSGAKPG